MLDDRRKYMRFDMPLNAAYRKYKDAKEYSKGMANNISREGIGLISEHEDTKVHSTLELQLQNPMQDDPVAVLADVMWNQKIGNKWHAGLKIREIDKASKMEILEYAYDKWAQTITTKKGS